MASRATPDTSTLAPAASDDDDGLIPVEAPVEFPRVDQQTDRQGPQTQSERARSPSPQPKPSADDETSSTPALAPVTLSPPPRRPTPVPSTPARVPSPAPSASPPVNPAVQSPPALATKPTQTASPTGAWAVLDTSLRALHRSAKVFPPVQSAVGLMIDCLDLMQQLAENHDEREELAVELSRMSDLMVRHMERSNSTWMTEAVANVARGIEEQMQIIAGKRDRGAGRRLLEANAEEEQLNKCYRQIRRLFQELQTDASLSMWEAVNDQTTNSLLYGLAPVHLATYNSIISTSISRRTCTANTRTTILSGLEDWSCNPTQADIYWMNGMAGTGKTTIACTFAKSLDEREQLAASFFCTRTVPECRAAARIIPTIAYQLARSSIPFRKALCESLEAHPDTSTVGLRLQFDRLLKEPLSKVEEMPSRRVVVIDALDECDDMPAVEELLSVLLTSASSLPLRFFVTSRPEPEIYHRMMARDQTYNDVLHLHAVETSLVQADIELYLGTELAPLSPALTDIQELTRRSGTLFIYAATLVRFIQPNKLHTNPKGRLRSVLSMARVSATQYAAIDALYRSVLEVALDEQNPSAVEVKDVRRVLYTVVCAQEPMSIGTLTAMAELDEEEQTLAALEPLRAVLHIPESMEPVTTLHASFPDFLFTKTRSESYHCDLAAFNEGFAHRCFEMMQDQLRFNICDIESSFIPDRQIEGIREKVATAISPALWYACQYWGDHLKNSTYSNSLYSELDDFLSARLLFWMEAMNLKQKMDTGLQLLAKAKLWSLTGTMSSDVSRYVEDARKFASTFAANPVSQSTPHIYLSSLPFCRKSSFVFQQYYKMTKGLVNLTGTALERDDATAVSSWTVGPAVYSVAPSPDGRMIAYGCKNGAVAIRNSGDGILVVGPLNGHTAQVNSVLYPPDGTQVASCSDDHTIVIWNAREGSIVVGPLEGHTSQVWSIAYSPDGASVVSGSEDRTIRVWNAQNGAPLVGPLKGHTASVESVGYSPNGTRIVSGSADNTIRVWNAEDGTPILGPLEGHTSIVVSVIYSPDGSRIVSGSGDRTIRVWNAYDGTLVAGPLKGHTDWVRSVVFSPDGTRFASGSDDSTIQVWDAKDGALVAGPFKGHTDYIHSVAYSPDGARIVSGSRDGTIRVWNAQVGAPMAQKPNSHSNSINSVTYSPNNTRIVSASSDHSIRIWHAHNGSLIVGPLEGHTASVASVAYSPVGTRIVSGSDDHTIRLWNVHDGAPVVGPLEGHTDSVRSVAYSSDGTRIVSGSDDRTIRVWDAEHGTLVAGPLEGHTGSVRSVVYSPDGTRIASGSSDRTIRVWNAHDGTLDVGPLEGHSSYVTSVAYSSDGTRIASGSLDQTIRVWNAKDGALVAGPFKGHTGWVMSVAYSPDGTRIVSGSDDKTIRVWNAEDGTLVAGPLNGHTDWVNSVAYSSDGTSIVSGSDDKTIRVWSARDGVSVAGLPAEGQKGPEKIDYIADGASVDASGWLTTSDSRLLLWVPPEVQPRDMLSQLRCHMVIGRADPLFVEYGDLVLGRRWTECYQS